MFLRRPARPHGSYPAKTLCSAALMALLASCSSEEAGLVAIEKIAKEKVKSAFGAALQEKGSASVEIGAHNLSVSVSGKSSTAAPSKPPGGQIVFRTEGPNDVTFQITARESVADVEKFYRASFAGEGLAEKDMANAGGQFRGEWVRPDGKPGAHVYAYGDENGMSRVAVVLIKQ